jgi:hypothetical protein
VIVQVDGLVGERHRGEDGAEWGVGLEPRPGVSQLSHSIPAQQAPQAVLN